MLLIKLINISFLSGTTQDLHIIEHHYKLVAYITAGFMMLTGLATCLSISCCLGVVFNNENKSKNIPNRIHDIEQKTLLDVSINNS